MKGPPASVILGAYLSAIAISVVTEFLLQRGRGELSPLLWLACAVLSSFFSIFVAVNMGYQAGRKEVAKSPDQVRHGGPQYSEQPVLTGINSSENVTVLREATSITSG
jgi:hypothetical protein